jgi:hypothetical protein
MLKSWAGRMTRPYIYPFTLSHSISAEVASAPSTDDHPPFD